MSRRGHARRTTTMLLALLGLLASAFAVTGVVPGVAPTPAAQATRGILETRVLGHTWAGRPILARRIGQPKSPRKVVILAAMHGDETAPDKILLNLRDGRQIYGADIWIVGHVNPDGVARHTRQNAHKVDLNRNFPRHWVHLYGTYYSGPRPASEPETRAIMRFLAEIRPRYVVSFHQPLYGVGMSDYARGVPFERRLSRGLGLPRKAFNCDGVCHGTLTDWFNHNFPGIAITVEYGHHISASRVRSGARGLLAAVFAHR